MHYAYTAEGWYAGPVADDTPGSTPIAPPLESVSEIPGDLRARWYRYEWRVEPYTAPVVPPQPVAYAFDTLGWYTGEVPIGTPDSTAAWPDITSTTTTPGEPRARWEAGTWVVRTYEAPAEPLPHVTRLAFLNRFSDAEAIAIDLASQGATAQAAAMRRYQSKVSAATYIDLSRPDTRSGVQALEAAGLLAAGRATEILDAPIQPSERPTT